MDNALIADKLYAGSRKCFEFAEEGEMNYNLTSPCTECPYLIGSGFKYRSLVEHASGEFACHKARKLEDGVYVERNEKTPHCAGALIFLEKQNKPHQMMRICERIGMYDRTKLNMSANVGKAARDYP